MPGRSLAVVLIALAMACSAHREGPPVDGASSRPPDFQGRIARIGDGSFTLATEASAEPREVVIAVRGSTRISNAQGKSLAPGDLAVGMHARVWLDPRAAGPLNVAASIVVEGP